MIVHFPVECRIMYNNVCFDWESSLYCNVDPVQTVHMRFVALLDLDTL